MGGAQDPFAVWRNSAMVLSQPKISSTRLRTRLVVADAAGRDLGEAGLSAELRLQQLELAPICLDGARARLGC
jgi:hypothetical protein